VHVKAKALAPSASSPASQEASAAPSGSSYKEPVDAIRALIDAPVPPSLSLSPSMNWMLYMDRPDHPPVALVAHWSKTELKLAGQRIDPAMNGPSRLQSYTGIRLVAIDAESESESPAGPEVPLSGLPEGALINWVSWSRGGRRFAFVVRTADDPRMSLWVADAETGRAAPVVVPPGSEVARQFAGEGSGVVEAQLNVLNNTHSWCGGDALVVSVVPEGRGPPPAAPAVPSGPVIQDYTDAAGEKAQARTYQDLLQNEQDADLFEYYTGCTVMHLALSSEEARVTKVTELGSGLFVRTSPSPNGEYVLLEEITKPFSYSVPQGRFPRRKTVVEVGSGREVYEVCWLPLAENIPITFDSCRQGRRVVGWRKDVGAELYFVEALDGGDSKRDVNGGPRDRVHVLSAPFADCEPRKFADVELRYSGITWGSGNLALLYDGWYDTRRTRTATLKPQAEDPQGGSVTVFDRSYEDSYADPGSPLLRVNELGQGVLHTLDEGNTLVLSGAGATPEGNIPFVDMLSLDSLEAKRVWRSAPGRVQYIAGLVSNSEAMSSARVSVVISDETREVPTNYFLCDIGTEVSGGDSTPPLGRQISFFPHPQPQILGMQKEIVKYKRKDGMQLTGTLYLPAGYDAERDGPLPTLMWAYPREFKSGDAAGQVRGSENSFLRIGWGGVLPWLLRGYAVLDGPAMAIVGEGDVEPNDTFVEQLVGCAEAAVEYVVGRGIADPKRVAVGGHSYGAFMTANLLAHCPDLFCCGIARSGAYNRTLTPFGFQSEQRSLWEVSDVYHTMSPFQNAHKVKKPILLIHGDEDNNPGTHKLQSERFYGALKGHGVTTRLVLLPFEKHGYTSRESIMHTLHEMDAWLETYCKGVQ